MATFPEVYILNTIPIKNPNCCVFVVVLWGWAVSFVRLFVCFVQIGKLILIHMDFQGWQIDQKYFLKRANLKDSHFPNLKITTTLISTL